jgi:hypothetical protein
MTSADRAGNQMKVVFSCVAENQEPWFRKVQNLVLSVRSFAGTLADSPIVVHFVDGVDDRFSRSLEALGAQVRVVEPIDRHYRFANKVRMLDLPRDMDVDVLVALDCDVIVVDDPSEFISSESFRAKPADCDFLSRSQWRQVFSHFSLPVPERQFVTTTLGQRTFPYFNSGVILAPGVLCSELSRRWIEFVHKLDAMQRLNAGWRLRRTYNDQIALTCALVAARIPVQALPVSMNFPTHVKVRSEFLRATSSIQMIHYHAGLDPSGFLSASRYGLVNTYADRFNRRRGSALGLPYEGLSPQPRGARLRQQLASTRWYHLSSIERVKRGIKTTMSAKRHGVVA